MNLKRLVFSILFLALAVGGYFGARNLSWRREIGKFVDARTYKDPNASNKYGLLLPDDIVEIQISNLIGNVKAERNEKGIWTLTEPYYGDVAQDLVPQMPNTLATLSEEKLVEDHPLDLEKYGLVKPDVVVKFKTKDGKWRETDFGGRAPTEPGYYTYNPETKKVFFTKYTLKQDFSGGVNDYLNKKLFRNSPKQADRIIVEMGGETYEFYMQMSSKNWFMEKPTPGKAYQNFLSSQLVYIGNMEGQYIVPLDKIVPDPEFDKPYAKITSIKNGIWNETLLVSPKVYANMRFVKRADSNFALAVLNDTFIELMENFKNMKSLYACWFPYKGVIRIELTRNGQTFVAVREDKTSPWNIEGRPDARVDNGAINTFLYKLQNLKNDGYVNAVMPAAGPQYGLDNPAATVKFDFINPKVFPQLTLYYGAKDPSGKFVYAYNSGDPNVMTVDSKALEFIPKSLEHILLK